MNKKSCSYSTNLRISAFLDFSANRQQRNSRITALRFVYIFLAICPFGWIGATFFHIWNTPNPGGFPTIQEFLFDLFSNNWGTITLFLFNVLIYLFVCFWGFILLKYQTHIKTTILLSAFWGLVIMFLCLHPSLLGIDIYTWELALSPIQRGFSGDSHNRSWQSSCLLPLLLSIIPCVRGAVLHNRSYFPLLKLDVGPLIINVSTKPLFLWETEVLCLVRNRIISFISIVDIAALKLYCISDNFFVTICEYSA